MPSMPLVFTVATMLGIAPSDGKERNPLSVMSTFCDLMTRCPNSLLLRMPP